jgi:hypothetical protein
VVSRRQLRAIGLSAEAIRHRVAVRRLRRVDEKVFAVGHLTAHGRHMAAVLGSGVGAVVSHRSAAALWDLRRWPLAGWHVLRIGWRQVLGQPSRVAALLRERLATA